MRSLRFISAAAVLAVMGVFIASPSGSAQSVASNKAFFVKNTDGITFAPIGVNGYSDVVTIVEPVAALKTSNGGAVAATLSMEASLWTYNVTEEIVNDNRKSSSSSRVAIKAWLEIDGEKMEPGKVVYADRLQATGLEINLTCDAGTDSCTIAGDATLELFQRTKNANAFTFFQGPLPATIHSIAAYAQAYVECRVDGVAGDCPQGMLDGYLDASTQAAIGKATLMVEEHQNWGKSGS